MKKFSFFFVFLLIGWFFTFCSQEPIPELESPSTTTPVLGRTIPVTEALSELDALLEDLDSPTRSNARRTYSAANVAVAGGACATRNGDETDLPDTLVYVVNFDRAEGFAVLSALRGTTPVYAITESGSLDADRINKAIADAHQRFTEGDSAAAATRVVEDENIKEIGIDIVPELLSEAIVLNSDIGSWDKPTPGGTTTLLGVAYSPWITKSAGPLVMTKWDQGYPFNMKCKQLTNADDIRNNPENNGRCAVGCVMTALGQILACNQKPITVPGVTSSCTWSTLLGVSNYQNFASFYYNTYDAFVAANPVYTNRTQRLAEFLRRLGDSEYCNGGYGAGTFSDIKRADSAMVRLDPVFYSGAKVSDLVMSMKKVDEMLDNGKPVFARGDSRTDGGHAWVIDGYRSQTRNKYETYHNTIFGEYTVTKFESLKFFHCNWGYQGECDGYYAEGVFVLSVYAEHDWCFDLDNKIFSNYEGCNLSYNTQVLTY